MTDSRMTEPTKTKATPKGKAKAKAKVAPKIKVTNYTYEQVDTILTAIQRDGKSLQTKIHSLAITILSHWANNADAGPECSEKMTLLQNASPYHSKSFADWVALLTGMKWAEETKRWYVQEGQKFRKDKLDACKGQPFWTVSPPAKAKPITDEVILKMLEGIITKTEKHEKEPVEGDKFSKVAHDDIRAAISKLRAVANT